MYMYVRRMLLTQVLFKIQSVTEGLILKIKMLDAHNCYLTLFPHISLPFCHSPNLEGGMMSCWTRWHHWDLNFRVTEPDATCPGYSSFSLEIMRFLVREFITVLSRMSVAIATTGFSCASFPFPIFDWQTFSDEATWNFNKWNLLEYLKQGQTKYYTILTTWTSMC